MLTQENSDVSNAISPPARAPRSFFTGIDCMPEKGHKKGECRHTQRPRKSTHLQTHETEYVVRISARTTNTANRRKITKTHSSNAEQCALNHWESERSSTIPSCTTIQLVLNTRFAKSGGKGLASFLDSNITSGATCGPRMYIWNR